MDALSAFFGLFLFAAPQTKEVELPRLPLRVAGVVVGYSRDADVRQLYGAGLFKPEEGHVGGRYYSDPSSSVTLHVEIGVDDVIEEATLSQGISASLKKKGALMQSQYLKMSDSTDYGVKLGDSVRSILDAFGPPKENKRDGNKRKIVYVADYETVPWVLYYSASFEFENDKLISLTIHNGD